MFAARRRLGWEIAGVIAGKLVLLGALYFAFFASPAPNDAPAVSSHVMGAK